MYNNIPKQHCNISFGFVDNSHEKNTNLPSGLSSICTDANIGDSQWTQNPKCDSCKDAGLEIAENLEILEQYDLEEMSKKNLPRKEGCRALYTASAFSKCSDGAAETAKVLTILGINRGR